MEMSFTPGGRDGIAEDLPELEKEAKTGLE